MGKLQSLYEKLAAPAHMILKKDCDYLSPDGEGERIRFRTLEMLSIVQFVPAEAVIFATFGYKYPTRLAYTGESLTGMRTTLENLHINEGEPQNWAENIFQAFKTDLDRMVEGLPIFIEAKIPWGYEDRFYDILKRLIEVYQQKEQTIADELDIKMCGF